VLLAAEANGGSMRGNKRNVVKRDIMMILFFVKYSPQTVL